MRETSRLHPVDLRILLALLDGPLHGYRVVKEVERREAGWQPILPANLYRRLRDLAAAGLVEETAPAAEPDGRPRRYFAVTQAGRDAARSEAARLADLVADARAKRLLPQAEGSR